jgi:hypothetical protein
LAVNFEDPDGPSPNGDSQAAVTLPLPGYYEIWVRATDEAGVSQPMLVPGWNPKGYLNNACHRIAVQAS